MPSADIPGNEEERLAALARYEILDTPEERAFDDVTRLVSEICQTPIAVVNLIADGRQWFKSEVGLGVRETPLDVSICSHAILQKELFVVPDTTQDERFADNPLVCGDPKLRFYAGALLETPDGYPLGTLCVLDVEPRELDEHQIAALRTLASHVMSLLELRRSMRRQAELNRQVEQALEDRQRLLATVSHDLRSPLSTVGLSASGIEEMTTEGDVRDLAGRILRAASSMRRLADDLVDQDGLSSGRLSVRREPTPLTPIVHDVVDRFRPVAAEQGVELALGPVELAAVEGDLERLGQVLSNLLSNAVAHTPRGGTVTLRVRRTDQEVHIEVEDTGPGIDEEDVARVFEPYWRAPGASGKGMGLGLSIVRGLTEAHGGRVSVESAPGEGAVFRVTLPILADPRRGHTA